MTTVHLVFTSVSWPATERSLLSQENSLAQYSTVHWPTCQSICTHTLSTRPAALGIAIVLFFQSLDALLHPTKGKIKWGFVVHAVAMFSSLTISITIILNQLSISFIDDRDAAIITDASGKSPPFQVLVSTPTTHLVSGLMFPLNQWLADGLLVIYDKDPVTLVFDMVSSPATSMLCYLRHELFRHSLPRFHISRYCWYASV